MTSKLEAIILTVVLMLGALLAVIGTSTILASGMMRIAREDAVEAAMRGPGGMGEAYLIHVSFSLALVFVAALLTSSRRSRGLRFAPAESVPKWLPYS